MGLATPMAIAVGVGRLTRQGVLVKGGATLERLAGIQRVVFDKTGTLTEGHLLLEQFDVLGKIEAASIKSYVAALAVHSNHPVSKAVAQTAAPAALTLVKEIEGFGIEGYDLDGRLWQLGSQKWLGGQTDHDLYIACDKILVGGMKLGDQLRPESADALAALPGLGVGVTLLSGDRLSKVTALASRLGILDFKAEQSPADKLTHLAAYQRLAPTAMVGDGVNDAPALAKAEVGISMGQGTQVAMQSAQVVLLRDDLRLVPEAIRVGRLTVRTIRENLFWAFAYNIIAIPVAALGLLNPMWAALFMSMSDVVIFINSLRLRRRK
jgi:Cu+-exporting ATPase